jgi:inner membrane protein
MDPITHGLASYVLKRAAFPRLSKPGTLAILFAGCAADFDLLSARFGPLNYLDWHRTYTHSLPAAAVIAAIASSPFFFLKRIPEEKRYSILVILGAALTSAILHLLMDVCQSAGAELLWPISTRRFALDWASHLDMWILGILLAGILLPLLSGLVTEEIGARPKSPHGKVGATLTLIALTFYLVSRGHLHTRAVTLLEARMYRAETPRRVAAYPVSSSPFLWRGVVETESALHEALLEVGPWPDTDLGLPITTFKPEASAALDATRNSLTGQRFLASTRFPKASVEKTPEGFHVVLRDFRSGNDANSELSIEARIETDISGRILSEHLAWTEKSKNFWWK